MILSKIVIEENNSSFEGKLPFKGIKCPCLYWVKFSSTSSDIMMFHFRNIQVNILAVYMIEFLFVQSVVKESGMTPCHCWLCHLSTPGLFSPHYSSTSTDVVPQPYGQEEGFERDPFPTLSACLEGLGFQLPPKGLR